MQTYTLVVWEGGVGYFKFPTWFIYFYGFKAKWAHSFTKIYVLDLLSTNYTHSVWNRGIHFFHICTFFPLLPFDPKTFLQIFLAKPYKNMYNDLNQFFEMWSNLVKYPCAKVKFKSKWQNCESSPSVTLS